MGDTKLEWSRTKTWRGGFKLLVIENRREKSGLSETKIQSRGEVTGRGNLSGSHGSWYGDLRIQASLSATTVWHFPKIPLNPEVTTTTSTTGSSPSLRTVTLSADLRKGTYRLSIPGIYEVRCAKTLVEERDGAVSTHTASSSEYVGGALWEIPEQRLPAGGTACGSWSGTSGTRAFSWSWCFVPLSQGGPTDAELEQALDRVEEALDIAGCIPGVGDLADIGNIALALSRGDSLRAALSALGLIPGIGDAIGKTAKQALKVADPKAAQELLDFLKRHQGDLGKLADTPVLKRFRERLEEIAGRSAAEGTLFRSIDDARKALFKEHLGDLGPHRRPIQGRLGEARGRTVGFESTERLRDGRELMRGYRLDWDPEKGLHYNYWKEIKGSGGSRIDGAVVVDGDPLVQKRQYLRELRLLEQGRSSR